MADTKISDLTAVDAIANDDDFVLADTSAAASKRATGTQISTYLASSTQTLTNKTFDANATGNALSNVETADIASGSKSGSDTTLITGTAGTAADLSVWDANGDLIDGPTPPSGTIVGTTDSQTLTNKTISGATLSGVLDAGGATSFELPNSATPTVNADGEIAVDTTVTDFSHGVLKYYGGEELGVLCMPIAQFTTPTDGYVPAYNATNDEFELVANSGSGLSNVVEDTTPQLGGQLDVNGNAIGNGTNELLTFTEDASAVNHVNIENEATGSGPIISSVGDDVNVDLNIDTKGTGALNLGSADSTVVMTGSSITGTLIKDEDTMTSDSATHLATQQSIKAYADSVAGIASVVADTTPQLGGQLDVNGNAIGDGTRELLTFTEDGSAVNHVNIENEATGSGPIISAVGDDANVDLNVQPKGTGNVTVSDGTDTTKKVSFEVSGATTAKTATVTSAHTDNRTITLPDATDTLVGKATTDTFTNKTFDANGTGNSLSNVDVADLAVGTDGELITWDASGNPATVAVGTATHVLTSNGAGTAPTFQAPTGGLSNVVEDTTPQLGADLDTNDFDILIDGGRGIRDESDNEQITFNTTVSAVNYLDVTNSATGNGPTFKSNGSDVNVDLNIDAKGAGTITIGTADVPVVLETDSINAKTGGSSILDMTDSGVRMGGANARVTTILDEDNLISDSATALATQQSIKAYIDGGASGITAVVEDTTPQLGGQLDVNANAIGDGTRELITFTEDASAVNHINIENEATGSGPILSAAGDDANIDLNLNGKATGNVVLRDGTDTTKDMTFELSGATTAKTATITSSHTDDRTITLPDATDTLVGKATTDTFTNKTFDANGTGNSLSNVDVADLAVGTDGELITWDASGNPATVAVGTSGHVLTSNGTGAAPTFQAAAGGMTHGTPVAASSQTDIDFTSLPAGLVRITVMMDGLSISAGAEVEIQLGDSGGFETSGYIGGSGAAGAGNTGSTSGFNIRTGATSSRTWSGALTLTLYETAADTWVAAGVFEGDSGYCVYSGGAKTLSGELTQVRITTDSTDTFDAGEVNIAYE